MAILVFCDKDGENLHNSSMELLSAANEIFTEPVIAATCGISDSEKLKHLGNYGASKVYSEKRISEIDSSQITKYISQICEEEPVSYILFSHDYTGKQLASRVASKLDLGIITAVISTEDGVFKRECYSGKAYEFLSFNSNSGVLTLTPNSFEISEKKIDAEIVEFPGALGESSINIIEKKILESKTVPLPDAEIVVSGGRGIKGPENWGMIEELAQEMSATTACSRPVADSGWRPHHEHVGQTGIAIRPNLYFAIGISGAIQHLAGVNGSKIKVVINNDPEAPFFKAAEYGIVGDAFEVVPQLIEEIKKHK